MVEDDVVWLPAWWRRRSPGASLKTRPEVNREQSLSMHALGSRLSG